MMSWWLIWLSRWAIRTQSLSMGGSVAYGGMFLSVVVGCFLLSPDVFLSVPWTSKEHFTHDCRQSFRKWQPVIILAPHLISVTHAPVHILRDSLWDSREWALLQVHGCLFSNPVLQSYCLLPCDRLTIRFVYPPPLPDSCYACSGAPYLKIAGDHCYCCL